MKIYQRQISHFSVEESTQTSVAGVMGQTYVTSVNTPAKNLKEHIQSWEIGDTETPTDVTGLGQQYRDQGGGVVDGTITLTVQQDDDAALRGGNDIVWGSDGTRYRGNLDILCFYGNDYTFDANEGLNKTGSAAKSSNASMMMAARGRVIGVTGGQDPDGVTTLTLEMVTVGGEGAVIRKSADAFA